MIRRLLWKYLFTNITDYCMVCQKRKTHHSADNCILIRYYEKLCKWLDISCGTCKHRRLLTTKDQLCCHNCPSYQFWEE